MTKCITILSRYSRLGASSRLRTMQYIPALTKAGFDVQLAPFFDDSYLQDLYAGQRRYSSLFKYYSRRWIQCQKARKSDVIWVEKEALPWLPWLIERMILPRGVPIVSDYDDAIFHYYDMHRNPLVRLFLGRKMDSVMANSAVVTAGNAYLADRARSAHAEKVEMIPTVVDITAYKPRVASHIDGKLRIGWIGTPKTWSKYGAPHVEFFRDLAQRHNASFRLVGARLERANDGAFEYVPWTEDTEVVSVQDMDIGIMPLVDDPLERGKCGYKLIQYMACGLPVVASPVGVNKEIVTHGENGFLASTQDEWGFALSTLLNDASLRKEMGNAGRRRVVESYSIQAQGPRIANLMSKIVARSNGL